MSHEWYLHADQRVVWRSISSPFAALVRRFPLLLWLAVAWPGQLLAQVPGVYHVDAKNSCIQIILYHGGLLGALTDNHLVVLHRFSGVAELSQASSWHLEMQGQAASLKVEDPGSSEADRKEVQEMMDGPEQLDVIRHPLIKLQSLSFQPTQQDTIWSLLADVTLHGVTRQEEFPLDCQQTGDRLRVRGEKMLLLRDFNIKPISRVFGAIKVDNGFKVTYEIVLERDH